MFSGFSEASQPTMSISFFIFFFPGLVVPTCESVNVDAF